MDTSPPQPTAAGRETAVGIALRVREFVRYRPTVPNESIPDPERRASMRKVIIAWCMGTIFFNGIAGAPAVGMFRSLGASAFWIGMLAAIPPLATLVQPVGSYIVARTGSRKRLFLRAAYPGRLVWVPIVLCGLFLPHGTATVLFLFAFVVVGQLSNALSAPAWISWVSDLVPEDERGRFWGTRQMWGYVFAISTSIGLGYYLGTSPPYSKFVVFFLLITVFGWLDVFFHRGVTGVRFDVPAERRSLGRLLREPLSDPHFRPLILFTALFAFSCQLAGGMFQLMLLEEIHLSYFEISLYLAGLLGGASMIASRLWGRLIDNIHEGERVVFFFCAAIVALIAVPWSMIGARQHLPIAAIVLVSGLGWSGYQIALTGLIIAYSPRQSRATYFAIQAVAAGIGNALGAVAGGSLAEAFAGLSIMWGPFKFTQLRTLYFLSGGLRIACLALLPFIKRPESRPIGVYVRRLFELNPFSRGTYVYIREKLSERGTQVGAGTS